MDASTKESIVWAAIAYVGKKRSQRDLLPMGDTTVHIEVVARVGRAKFLSSLSGKLHVSPDGKSASNSEANAAEVAAALLASMSDDQRSKVLASLTSHYEKHGALPEVPEEVQSAADTWLARMRSSTSSTKRGAVTFAQFDK